MNSSKVYSGENFNDLSFFSLFNLKDWDSEDQFAKLDN